MKRRHHRRTQKPIPGGREAIWGAIDPQLRRWVERQAARDDCSLSLVVNSTLSFASGIPLIGETRRAHREPARVLNMRRG
jgi:hypothetical protein